MQSMKFKAAIFDLDGVIVDTIDLHFKAWKKMFSEFGKEFDFEDYKQKVDGILRVDGAKAVLTDLAEEELKEAATRKQNYFLEFLEKEGVKIHQSTIDLISELKSKGIKLGVISSSRNCRLILQKAGVEGLFETVVAGNDIERGKPNPDVFLHAAANLSVSPSDCLVFEDAALGVAASRRANIKCVGIDRYNHPERLASADLVVGDLSEVTIDKLNELFK